MRLLIVSQYYWPENFRINDLAAALHKNGVELEVLTGKPNYPSGQIFDGYRLSGFQQEIHHGARINRVPLFPRKNGGLWLILNYLSFVFVGLLFGPWLLRKKKYDVIFVAAPSPVLQAIPAIFIGWLKKAPVVLWVQDLWPESLSATGYVKNRVILALVREVVRFIYRNVDTILISSKAFETPIRQLVDKTPIVYYPNSVDESFVAAPQCDVPRVGGLGSGFSVMFAGNIGAAQGVAVIIDAAELLREYDDINFVVLGDGSAREWMLSEVKQRALHNVHLPGRFPVETMPTFMQQASVLLVTLADQPIFSLTVPNKIQAYMAVGKPILACLNGEGARIVTEAQAGIAVRAEAAPELAEAILYLHAQGSESLQKMGRNGREYYRQNFDHTMLVNQLISKLSSVAQRGKGSL